MKFKHFNIKDVLSTDDTKEAVKYIGKKGYYSDSLESLDRYIEDKEHIDYLYSVKKKAIFSLILSLDIVGALVVFVTTFCH